MHHKRGGYSYLIRPILIVIDLIILFISSYYLLSSIVSNQFYVFLGTIWLVSAYLLDFYEVYRFTKAITIISLLFRQATVILILIYAYLGVLRINLFSGKEPLYFIIIVISTVGIIKVISYYALKRYRSYLGGNNRRVIIIGNNKSANQLMAIFEEKKDLGYQVLGVFSDTLSKSIKDSFDFLEEEEVDEIYCAIDEISDDIMNEYVKYVDQNYCVLKFIPSSQRIYSKRLTTDYYEYLPVLSIPEISLNSAVNRTIKRGFDIIFSILIIILILSWITPLLFIFIKLESKGPLIYSQKRNGINYKEFICYKFRSMRYKKHVELDQVKKEDIRVTRIGRFMRRTSIDELPQFFNVLLGDMSVVGPRPHMISYTKDYAKKIDKYNFVFRHAVKPGITGLAQIKGYRGEVKYDEEIVNRIKHDIFYIENWSVLLDLKIILDTIINIIKGQEKAY
ncbi:exopolysaccharide biosynthesis polyprenyl glycosylphosphotransferase [Aquimarina algiphila]|uniref:exopolysaccharide biosynthesis polyprenyl glycosylphosphotransferase n=1 Tax=Aquimarina algiphila TaxID=2047982 RepID=UPI0024918CDA|nr:exopolysaccharide biosynthesis polyprenyl glycosylphosphotransferase [Aquimarina algiphila]